MPDSFEMQSQFEACVDQCADSIYRVAFRLTGNDTLAMELVQNTYLEAWRCIGQLKEKEKMRGWIFSILRNQYSKLLRIEKRSIPTTDVIGEVAQNQDNVDCVSSGVQEAIDQIEDKFRLPLLLVAIDQMSVDMAAEVLNIPRGTVLSRLHRGREKLRRLLIQTQRSH